MNIIDILILFVLLYAAYRGFCEGLVVQIFSIVGMAIGLFVGSRYSSETADLFNIDGAHSKLLGFLIATIAVLLAIAFAGRALRKLVSITGLGFIDVAGGAALSVCKFLLVLSLAFTAVNMANHKYKIFDKKELASSKLYMPIANLSNYFSPAWDWVNKQMPKR